VRLAEVTALAGDHRRARELYQRLGHEGTNPERAQALLALAEVERRGLGDLASSHAAATSAFALGAADPAVLPQLEEHFERTEDWGAFTTLGDDALSHASAPTPGTLALRLSLARVYRERLRVAERADQHLRAAIEAFPRSPEPRLALAYGLLGSHDVAAVNELRRVLEIDPLHPDAYRGLLAVCVRLGAHGAAAMMASVLALLGEEGGQVQGALAQSMAPSPLPGALPAEDALAMLVGATGARFLRRVLAVIDPHLHELFPAGQDSLDERTPLPEQHPAAVRARAIGAALGVNSLPLYRGRGGDGGIVLSDPRALVLGAEHLTDGGIPRLQFDVALACARIAAGSTAGQVLPAEQLFAVLTVATDANADGPGYRELRKRVKSALSWRARKELDRVVTEAPGDLRLEWGPWQEEERTRALRLGVVVCRDLRVVAGLCASEALAAPNGEARRRRLAESPAMIDALRFAASEACWAAHRRLYGQP
jgi:hypothetical protein